MRKIFLSILIIILYINSNAQSPLRINKYLIDSLTGSGYWYLYHDSTHTGQWGLVAGSGGGGGSGISSLSQAYGIINTPNPITSTGTVKFDSATVFSNLKWARILDNELLVAGTTFYYPQLYRDIDIDMNGNNFFIDDADDFAVNLNNNEFAISGSNGGSNTVTIISNTGSNRLRILSAFNTSSGYESEIFMTPDSLRLKAHQGRLNFDTLRAGSTTSVNTLVGWSQGSNQGPVGYVTMGFGETLSGGALSVDSTSGGLTSWVRAKKIIDSLTSALPNQTLASTSDATSHTVTLSNSGGSIQLVEGSNITLTTTGTGLNGIVTIASTGGGGASWNGITDPTGDQALTFQAGESSTWTDQNTTEDLFTVNNATSTTNSLFSLNRTSTALAAGNNIMELVSSGANGTSSITSTLLRLSNTNTGTTNTNVGLNVITSGATNNYAILAQGYVGISTPAAGAFSPTSSIHIKDANTGVVSLQIDDEGSSQYRLKIREYGSTFENFSSNFVIYNAFSSGGLSLGGGGTTNQVVLDGKGLYNRSRFHIQQAADVASANNLSIPTTFATLGNLIEVTGTTQINLIDAADWQNGSIIYLMFSSSLTIKNGQATSGGNTTILLAGAVDFAATANDVITLQLGEIGGTVAWREIGRSVN